MLGYSIPPLAGLVHPSSQACLPSVKRIALFSLRTGRSLP